MARGTRYAVLRYFLNRHPAKNECDSTLQNRESLFLRRATHFAVELTTKILFSRREGSNKGLGMPSKNWSKNA
jgi:hypothetical protein